MKTKTKKILLSVAGGLLLVVSVLALNHLLAGIGITLAGVLIFGPNVEQIKGKTGGIVYTSGKTGPFTRARIKPRNPKTGYQELIRQDLRKFAQLWNSTTVTQSSFNDYAATHPVKNRLGRTVYISGYQWFIRLQLIAQEAGATSPLLVAPATTTAFPIMSKLAFGATTGPDAITLTPVLTGTLPTGLKIEVMATRQLSAGRFSPTGYRRIGVYDPILTPTVDITTDYEARFTTLQDGLKIFAKGRLIMPTGEADLYVSEYSIVTPVA